jgi:hypothetical protein
VSGAALLEVLAEMSTWPKAVTARSPKMIRDRRALEILVALNASATNIGGKLC